MIEKLMRKYALSRQGAKDLVKGCLACVLQNLAFMPPVALLYFMVSDLMAGTITGEKIWFYIIGIILCLAFIAFAATLQYNATFFATYTESRVRRITLAEKLRKLPLSFFAKRDLADLSSAFMADCSFLETAFSHFIHELVGSIISTVIIALSLFIFDWRMALAAFWVVPVSFIIMLASSKLQRNASRRNMKAKLDCADGIQECIETITDLKANNAETDYLKGVTKKIKVVEHCATTAEFTTASFVTSSFTVLKLGIGTVALVGGMLITSGSIDLLTFFMFLLVASRLYEPLQAALQNLAAVISADINIARMNEILLHDEQKGTDKLTNNGCDIRFDDVSFSYKDGENILHNVSFTAKQGEASALVGPSGGGKTTVSRLAARFWDSDSGKVTVGGMDVSKVDPETLLSLYSIVFQDVTLFNNTILENIRIGRKDATDEEVIAAAKLANCDEFAEKLPDKWNSMIGENGCELSGGERQRISIARAFLKNSPIVLLDEATASLDVENETLIQSALSRLIKDKTVLVIAHRMRTVAGADKIVVLADGKVAEQGSPDELYKNGGIYTEMVDKQLKGSTWSIA